VWRIECVLLQCVLFTDRMCSLGTWQLERDLLKGVFILTDRLRSLRMSSPGMWQLECVLLEGVFHSQALDRWVENVAELKAVAAKRSKVVLRWKFQVSGECASYACLICMPYMYALYEARSYCVGSSRWMERWWSSSLMCALNVCLKCVP
jgi:hypothetical protein